MPFGEITEMKRIHLFEFEDLAWFPQWLRTRMTRFIMAMHKILGTREHVAALLKRAVDHSGEKQILDLCSGSGGPMEDVGNLLQTKYNLDTKITLSDLYPHQAAANKINQNDSGRLTYITEPVNAANVSAELPGIRTLICSFHHMKPDTARDILKDASDAAQPILVFEISDNSFPKWLWWIAIPVNILSTIFITPLIRPMSWQQVVFTYIIPVLPLLIAWDGAVSNARTYTQDDLDTLLNDLEDDNYVWEKGIVKGKSSNLYLLGLPKRDQ